MNKNFTEWLANKKENNILIVNSKTDIKKELENRKMWGTIHIWIENTNTVFKVLVFKETEKYDIFKFEVKEDYFEEIVAYTQVNIKEAIEIIKSDDSNILSIATELLKIKPDCKACGMGIACCGCPQIHSFQDQYKAFVGTIGKERLDAAIEYAEKKKAVENKAKELKIAENECEIAYKKYSNMQ